VQPMIGLTISRSGEGVGRHDGVRVAYLDAIYRAGGLPVLLPNGSPAEVMDRMDGLLLTGGGDFDPAWYHQPNLGTPVGAICLLRDRTELLLIRRAMERTLPILGICRGVQALAVAFGGTLIQDLSPLGLEPKVSHYQSRDRDVATHLVTIEPHSRLWDIVGADRVLVNSFHHQAVALAPPGWRAVAHSDDGVMEAMERSGAALALGVQWHPEDGAASGDRRAQAIFSELVEDARRFKQMRGDQ